MLREAKVESGEAGRNRKTNPRGSRPESEKHYHSSLWNLIYRIYMQGDVVGFFFVTLNDIHFENVCP